MPIKTIAGEIEYLYKNLDKLDTELLLALLNILEANDGSWNCNSAIRRLIKAAIDASSPDVIAASLTITDRRLIHALYKYAVTYEPGSKLPGEEDRYFID